MTDTETLSVDLKWSLWSADWMTWNEKTGQPDLEAEPGYMWKRMEQAFDGSARPVRVHTAPRKEIRFGTVYITQGQAEVDFEAVWDEAYCLVELVKWSLPDELVDQAIEHIRNWFYEDEPIMVNEDGDNLGAQIGDVIFAESFDALMEAIDLRETQLLMIEGERGKAFDEYLDGYLKVQLGLAEDDGSY